MCALDFVGYHHTLSVPIPVLVGGSYHCLNCKHIFRITYSINAHPVIALMFSQTGTDVLPRRDEGSDKPSPTIEPHRIMVPTRTRTQAAGLKVRCRYHYTTAAHIRIVGACINYDLMCVKMRKTASRIYMNTN